MLIRAPVAELQSCASIRRRASTHLLGRIALWLEVRLPLRSCGRPGPRARSISADRVVDIVASELVGQANPAIGGIGDDGGPTGVGGRSFPKTEDFRLRGAKERRAVRRSARPHRMPLMTAGRPFLSPPPSRLPLVRMRRLRFKRPHGNRRAAPSNRAHRGKPPVDRSGLGVATPVQRQIHERSPSAGSHVANRRRHSTICQ